MEAQRMAKEAKQKAAAERRERLVFAFNDLAFEGGFAPLAALAEASGLDGLIDGEGKPSKAFTGMLTAAKLRRCRDGNVRTSADAAAWEAENPPEPKLTKSEAEWAAKTHRCRLAILRAQREAPDGIARIGAVVDILALPSKNPINTVRGWVDRCTEYRRTEDGQILPVEDK